MADTTVPGMFATGDHASRPAAGDVGSGALYSCTDHDLIYQSDGSSWTTWATLGGGASGLLGVVSRSANGSAYTTSSATLGDVDATNAAVTFTAPASGNVLVRMSAGIGVDAAQTGFFGIRESTTDVGIKRFVMNGTTPPIIRSTAEWLITGISAGSHTYKAAFCVNGGATLSIFQEAAAAGNGALIVEVWAAP
jgi:hypothetical protein